jgi:hypothetical protein
MLLLMGIRYLVWASPAFKGSMLKRLINGLMTNIRFQETFPYCLATAIMVHLLGQIQDEAYQQRQVF